MFTGIIEEVGSIAEMKRGTDPDGGARIVVSATIALQDGPSGPKITEGESIAVNGVCLTARDINSTTFSADLAPRR